MSTLDNTTQKVVVTTDGRVLVEGFEIKPEAIEILKYLMEKPDEAHENFVACAEGIANIALYQCECKAHDMEEGFEIPIDFMFSMRRMMDLLKLYCQKGGTK